MVPAAGTPGFALEHWAAWAPGLEKREDWLRWAKNPRLPGGPTAPAVAGMPALLRRRAHRLGRMALEVLYQSTRQDTPIVYCSRHGELERAVILLEELAASGSVSPLSFSVAVHNATAGLYSIATRCHENIQSIAAGEATPFAGLIEALGLIHEGAAGVRVVLCDEPVPPVFSDFAEAFDCPYAVLLELAPGRDFHVEWPATALTVSQTALPPALALLHFLLTGAAETAIARGPGTWRVLRRQPVG